MIDFNSLELVVKNNYSFVGIEKQGNALYFCLPKGFADNILQLNTFASKRDLFFLLYRIFNTFKEVLVEKGYLDETSKFGVQDRDGVIKNNSGSEIQNSEDGSENIFYSKLDIIGQLLNAYDEPKILALAYRLGKCEKFDISQIHKYLHQAVYLPNHAAYVDQIVLPRPAVQFESSDIVTMYCYVFCEIKIQLQENVSSEITALAERFRQHYLEAQDSLFDEQSHEQILATLKDALEKIDNHTPIKDFDYWQYFESIELFLYGDWHQADDGEIWGIKDFYSVWESMCLTCLVKNVDSSELLHVDSCYINPQILAKYNLSTKTLDLSNVFQVNGSQLVPDAVRFSSLISQTKEEKNYSIYVGSDWNDYGYQTIISGFGIKEAKICYINQLISIHTIEKIKEFYKKEGWSGVINAPLPRIFYSFWDIPDQIDSDHICKMRYFNHLFYLALERRIMNWDEFYKEILRPLGVIFGLSHDDLRANAFTHSLFRGSTQESVAKKFNLFIERVFLQWKEFFEIIDIKYQTSEYFADSSKMEDIKYRSVRKQFVYEHLLQKKLERTNNQFSNSSIRSTFWIPSYRPDDLTLLEDGAVFMDGYIQLKSVNFSVLAKSYLS